MVRPTKQPAPVPSETWTPAERNAWRLPPDIKPSQWAVEHFRIRRGYRKGPYRHENAPYLKGIMDIATRPGVVQANLMKGVQMGGSTLTRILMAWRAHTRPGPCGLTLPNRDKGRKIIKSDVLPLFRRTPVLRELIGRESSDMLIETIDLLNGYRLSLMWSGSATSMASDPMMEVINDEVDKFEIWSGEEPDAIAATEFRLTSFGDRRLQVNLSTPTVTAGKIHQLCQASTVKLFYHVPCPHCGHHQVLKWSQMQWLNPTLTRACLEAAQEALAAGRLQYQAGDSIASFPTPLAMHDHVLWLKGMLTRWDAVGGRREAADLLNRFGDRAVWYVCDHCQARISTSDRTVMVRRGLWTTAEGFVLDAHEQQHADAETIERFAPETRVAFQISALYCPWVQWAGLVGQFLRAIDDPSALFAFTTNRLAEPFEFKMRRVAETVFSAKCERSKAPEGTAPAWAAALLATIDTQVDHLYVVVRAWGPGLRSQRVWHGKVLDFAGLDQVLARAWPVDSGGEQAIGLTLIDSGGTVDRFLDATRTQQVYDYALARQPLVRAIKGASRPVVGLYAPMKNPMGTLAGTKEEKVGLPALAAYLIDTHRCNDLLSELIAAGIPTADGRNVGPAGQQEAWLLNAHNDSEYNLHLSNVQKTVDPKTKREMWVPKVSGARHDYRDCEAYQVAAAYMAYIHLLPAEDELRRSPAPVPHAPTNEEPPVSDGGSSYAAPL